ncbi:hypothetical protein [Nocardiopsis sp. JB363]|uniref:hypothetical protein n=1 Tax=Nocardiopsis sp. JB363 TaxID=1434837 RepID=UPI000979D646|nr:hypothetical protein [Nocardiopsis sp. JB363]SIO86154.1 hypothetical protein BQ8420_10565 [Nocardiopsis sp. JB363]
MSCANLDCDRDPAARLRYKAPDRDHVYELCEAHLDHAHVWLADRPHLAVTAVSERLAAEADQPALF